VHATAPAPASHASHASKGMARPAGKTATPTAPPPASTTEVWGPSGVATGALFSQLVDTTR
jgi:hypothetical protein